MYLSSKSLLSPILNRTEFSPPPLGDLRSKCCSLFKALRFDPVGCWTPSNPSVKSLSTGNAQSIRQLGACHTAVVSNCFLHFPTWTWSLWFPPSFSDVPASPGSLLTKSHQKGCNTVTVAWRLQAKACFYGLLLSSALLSLCSPRGRWHPLVCAQVVSALVGPCSLQTPRNYQINHCNTKCQGTHF